eukprot:TRINITY_DN39390_c0_g1_i2.p1 TRINITY_DN39390_c0_g1~~TRINITY_DN39390_c0_g1_i2.p1  ORF type:complete len:205 (+),score=31.44 TRINITY_DN39390_c0_g1_i2:3-617(+)
MKDSKQAIKCKSLFHQLKNKTPNKQYLGVYKRLRRNEKDPVYSVEISQYSNRKILCRERLCRKGFKTPVEAARCYDRMVILLQGFDQAITNFPKSNYQDLKNVRSEVRGKYRTQQSLKKGDSAQEYKDLGGNEKKDNIPPWLSKVTPELGRLMESMRDMANVQNLGRERRRDLAPEVLLACAVLVEECAKDFTKANAQIIKQNF